MRHLDPGLAVRDGAGGHLGLGPGDVLARADRAGVPVAARPVGAAEPRVAETGEGAEQHQVEAEEERQQRQRSQARQRPALPMPAPEPEQRHEREHQPDPDDAGDGRQDDVGGHRPAWSQPDEARSSLSMSRFSFAGSTSAGARSIQPPAGIDQIEVVLERTTGGRRNQPAMRVARRAQHRRRREGRAFDAGGADRRQRLAVGAARRRRSSQSLSIRPLSRPKLSCSCRCSQRWRSHAASQPAADTTTSSHCPCKAESGATGVPAGRTAQSGRHRPRRVDQIAVVGAPFRTNDEIHEVRRHHRRGADEQDERHHQTARGRFACVHRPRSAKAASER